MKQAPTGQAKRRRGSQAAEAAGPAAESLFGVSDFHGAAAAEQRLRKELDDELRRPAKKRTPAAKPHLNEVGQAGPTTKASAAPVVEEGAPEEESSSGEEEAVGFWSQSPA